jgi:hypothetical protein
MMRRVKHQKQIWRIMWRRVRREILVEMKVGSLMERDPEVWLEVEVGWEAAVEVAEEVDVEEEGYKARRFGEYCWLSLDEIWMQWKIRMMTKTRREMMWMIVGMEEALTLWV